MREEMREAIRGAISLQVISTDEPNMSESQFAVLSGSV